MTPLDCADNLAKLLRSEFVEFVKADEKIALNDVVIKSGFLPKTSSSEEKKKQCPAIIIRPVEVDDSGDDESSIKLEVLFITYNENKDSGHLELYHMLELARQTMLKNRLVNKKNRLILPVKTVIPEEQPFPQWWGYMIVKYSIGQPREMTKYNW